MSSRKQQGFTLIELMIVVAIIGIIAGIAYPSYMESVRKSNRSDAKASLNDVAQRLQRCFTAYNSYVHDSCTLGKSLDAVDGAVDSGERMYSIGANDGNGIDATSFTLTATPVAGTSQANDRKCLTFTLTQAGVRNATGSDAANCW